MHKPWRVACVVLGISGSVGLLGVPGAGAMGPATPATARPPIDRVLILSLPGVSWRDVASHRTPHLRRLLDGAAIADLSTRAPKLRNRLADNYASLGAGDKAVGAGNGADPAGIDPAGASFDVDELLGTTTAGAVFARRTGHAAGSGLVVLGVQQLLAANASTPFHARGRRVRGCARRSGMEPVGDRQRRRPRRRRPGAGPAPRGGDRAHGRVGHRAVG